ncbi:MAG: CapA family protein [Streptococcus sp.]
MKGPLIRIMGFRAIHFQCPGEVVASIKEAGYQVMDLGITYPRFWLGRAVFDCKAFEDAGIQTVGVYPHETRDQAPILIKEVNGIKIAILAYSYGFNGMEYNLEQEDYDNRHRTSMRSGCVKKSKSEMEADVTIVMPQMGNEYELEPTEEQKELYHKMISWGRISSWVVILMSSSLLRLWIRMGNEIDRLF